MDTVALGASYSSQTLTNFLTGDIYEARFYDVELSEAQMLQAQREMSWMCGGALEAPMILAHFTSTDESLYMNQSWDNGTNARVPFKASYRPATGTNKVRDPSIWYDRASETWYVAHTHITFAETTQSFGMGKSRDGRFWLPMAAVTPGGISSVDLVYAPEWFIDWDGSVYIIVAIDTAPDANTIKVYWIKCKNSNFTSWTDAVELNLGFSGRTLDTHLSRQADGLIWACAHEIGTNNIRIFKATSIGDAFRNTATVSTNNEYREGECLVRLSDGRYRLFADQTWISYFESVDGITWTSEQLCCGNRCAHRRSRRAFATVRRGRCGRVTRASRQQARPRRLRWGCSPNPRTITTTVRFFASWAGQGPGRRCESRITLEARGLPRWMERG